MRLIDADALFPNGVFFVNGNNPMTSLDELLNRIQNAPTIDAVPVVRCKDCKHGTAFGEDYNCRIYPEWYWFKGDHFCADGERRDDNA